MQIAVLLDQPGEFRAVAVTEQRLVCRAGHGSTAQEGWRLSSPSTVAR
jgi:hypothetical protein